MATPRPSDALRYFSSTEEVLNYIKSEFIETLQDDLRVMEGPERKLHSASDRTEMRRRIHDVKLVMATLIP